MEQPISFAIGDVVTFVSDDNNEEQVITDVSFDEGEVLYGVSGCAWFYKNDLEFVRRADALTFEKVNAIVLAEQEEECEDE